MPGPTCKRGREREREGERRKESQREIESEGERVRGRERLPRLDVFAFGWNLGFGVWGLGFRV